MNEKETIDRSERVLGGLWGAVVGDALGVPFEFLDRTELRADPAIDMVGHGTHNQPKGTWSDDSSLLLCAADSLVRKDFDLQDMGKRFLSWHRAQLWTPHGKVLDVGTTTARALARIHAGVRAEAAGEDDEYSNGNGSLMRIIPVSLRFAHEPVKSLLDRVHRASAITHRHLRSQMACGFYSLVIRELLAGADPTSALSRASTSFRGFYEPDPYWGVEIWGLELPTFQMLLAGDLRARPETEIDSSGYVIHTLTASLWCLLTTNSYPECVLKAVNLGGDTDTTGCVAGGLAGVLYGANAIPQPWRTALARNNEIETLFDEFANRTNAQSTKGTKT